ncbi:DUF6783 domain-containing protein [Robinsoniella sp.]
MKNHSLHLHAPLCGIFAPNSGYRRYEKDTQNYIIMIRSLFKK